MTESSYSIRFYYFSRWFITVSFHTFPSAEFAEIRVIVFYSVYRELRELYIAEIKLYIASFSYFHGIRHCFLVTAEELSHFVG